MAFCTDPPAASELVRAPTRRQGLWALLEEVLNVNFESEEDLLNIDSMKSGFPFASQNTYKYIYICIYYIYITYFI